MRSSNCVRRLRLLCLLAVLLLTASCGYWVRTRAFLGAKVHMSVQIAPAANQNNPVAMELLLVYDQKLLDTLMKTPAREWFEKREQFRQDNPEGKGFDSWHWEWVPGEMVPPQTLPLKANAKAGIIFANYVAAGEFRARINGKKNFTVSLGDRSLTVTEK
jgi:type VI secretion system protein